ncbi:MAG: GNAT family N-acetyltransferase [Anaerolineae bacterium]|jgi:predicted GNAT superfamily acetyltransferase|nr:GNAT family N-acetyltransferase [Anaerolineae bacterium]MBT7072704.1 GNAT family N-acetyltransferase [Anaerolineae bacterium]MBT7324519.1 GNAT family N-acetyltransferase [Anaerolineae bacterium]
MPPYTIRLLEKHEEIRQLGKLVDKIWRGGPADVVPAHILVTFIHNGGLAFGAFKNDEMIGLTFGFPGFTDTPQGRKLKHCSHQMGVHPDHRGKGIGFALKKAQWQMVRQQGLDLVTWTYDPLLSPNARLNIARLGAVCNTYRREEYGEMVDELNAGLASDRFQVDWWVNTRRVHLHLDEENFTRVSLDDYRKADAQFLYAPETDAASSLLMPPNTYARPQQRLLLVEIPSNFQLIRRTSPAIARDWRFFTREIFEEAFAMGYIVTDFLYERSEGNSRGFYLLTDGESTLG